MTRSGKDWNTVDEFFTFSRGRFVINEAENVRKRRVRFDMNEFARVAAAAIGSRECVHIEKCPDGMYNKSYLFTMDDQRQVIGKVPNPNAGQPSLTTASEVATMDFVRNILDTPAPCVHAWSSDMSNTIGSEYIIMDKVQGVQLSQVWRQMKLTDRLKIVIQLYKFQKKWLSARFATTGSLYYAKDVDPSISRPCKFTHADGQEVTDGRFAIGPMTGRDWTDEGRSTLRCNRGPFHSVLDYCKAIIHREVTAVQLIEQFPKQMVMLCGPGLYQPSRDKKIAALWHISQLLYYLLPSEPSLCTSHVWHNDLHEENIFVDPTDPTVITGIIDWQTTQVAPLFEQIIDPGLLDYEGPRVESLDTPELPENHSQLSSEEQAAQISIYYSQGLLVAYRKLAQQTASLKAAIDFQGTRAFAALKIMRRIFEVGEAHLEAILLDIREEWESLPAVRADGNPAFPLSISESEIQQIDQDIEAADAGIAAMSEVKRRLGGLWPDKGAVTPEYYEQTKQLLNELKGELMSTLSLDEEGKKVFEYHWPFEK